MKVCSESYKRHRFPGEVIAHAVWLYYRFPLSYRLTEEMLCERGLVVSYKTICWWSRKFGHAYTTRLRRKSAKPVRIVTEKRHVMPSVRHLTHKRLNNRAENAHLPLRKREKVMQKFRSPDGSQLFLCVFSAVRNLFVPPDQKSSALSKHIHRLQAFAQWNSVTALQA